MLRSPHHIRSRIIAEQPHLEAAAAACKGTSDASKTNNPNRGPPQSVMKRSAPATGAHQLITANKIPRNACHQSEGAICDRLMVCPERHGDRDPMLRRRGHVDIVVADTKARDNLQVLCCR